MSSIKNTTTEKNLEAALIGESLARSKYAFYEEAARKAGQEDIANLFHQMTRNETYHAKIWYTLLNKPLGDSSSNIMDAANGENQEWRNMYPSFADQARKDGLDDVAEMFEKVAAIEKNHEEIFLKALIQLKSAGLPKTEAAEHNTADVPAAHKPAYRCMFCGAVRDTPMDVCDVCNAIGAFEEI